MSRHKRHVPHKHRAIKPRPERPLDKRQPQNHEDRSDLRRDAYLSAASLRSEAADAEA